MAIQVGERLKAFFNEPVPIVIGTTRRDGSIQMNPIWYEFREGQIWVNGGPNRGWFKHVQRDGRLTLLILDPKNMFRWAQIQGRLAGSTAQGADDHIEHLSQRYTGGPYRNPKVDRLIIRVDIERVTGFESGQAWDVSG
jgi:PPOX class probable F420-dependent enzyme